MPRGTIPSRVEPEERIDIDAPSRLNLAALGRKIDASLTKKIGRLIEREPDRSLSVVRRWLRQ